MATGKRAGARRATPARTPRKIDGRILGLAAGITLCVIAWGYLVYAAIDFGNAARSGSGGAWAMLLLAALGAMACLFAGLMLGSRLTTALGMSQSSTAAHAHSNEHEDGSESSPSLASPPQPSRPPGGRRAAR